MTNTPTFVNDETDEYVVEEQLTGLCFDAHYVVVSGPIAISQLDKREVAFKPGGGVRARDDFTGRLGAGV